MYRLKSTRATVCSCGGVSAAAASSGTAEAKIPIKTCTTKFPCTMQSSPYAAYPYT